MILAQELAGIVPNAVGFVGMKIAGKKQRLGWAIGVWSELAWLLYAIWTGQWGVVPWCPVWGYVYAQNWMKWRAEEVSVG